MGIVDIPSVSDWLSQFEIPDRYLAEYMLHKLRYVSFEEVDAWVQKEVSALLTQISARSVKKEAIALFPVAKPFIHQFNKDKDLKPANDSAGRIAHSLRNLERNLPGYIELTPRIESMRDRKVKHIIYVDDFIGTGDRFIKSWRQTVPRSVKAWCSRGWCQIWILAFVAHETGIKKILNQIGPATEQNFRVGHRLDKSFIYENRDLVNLCGKYGSQLNEKKANFGYGNLLSPIVFQYGCPNNAPGILWCKGKHTKKKWKPLFPERSVPVDLYPIFGVDHSVESTAEELWMARHYKLALAFAEKPTNFHEGHRHISVLAYLNQGKELAKIRTVMVMSDTEFDALINELKSHGLLDDHNNLTRFGKDILKRGEKIRVHTDNSRSYGNYYPSSFLGFQREV